MVYPASYTNQKMAHLFLGFVIFQWFYLPLFFYMICMIKFIYCSQLANWPEEKHIKGLSLLSSKHPWPCEEILLAFCIEFDWFNFFFWMYGCHYAKKDWALNNPHVSVDSGSVQRKQCCSAKPPRRLNVAESMQHQRNRAQKYEARIYTSGYQSQLNGVICVYAENSLNLLSSCLWGLRFGWMLSKGHWTLEN